MKTKIDKEQFSSVINTGTYLNQKKVRKILAEKEKNTTFTSKVLKQGAKIKTDVMQEYTKYQAVLELGRLITHPEETLLNIAAATAFKIIEENNSKIKVATQTLSYCSIYNKTNTFLHSGSLSSIPYLSEIGVQIPKSIPFTSEINAMIPRSPVVDLVANSINTQNEEFTMNTIKAIESRLTLSKNGNLTFKKFNNSKYFEEINKVMENIIFDMTLNASPKKGESAADFFNRYLQESSKGYILNPLKGLAWVSSTALSSVSTTLKGAAMIVSPVTTMIGTGNPLEQSQKYIQEISNKPLEYVIKYSDHRAKLALAVQHGVSELSQ